MKHNPITNRTSDTTRTWPWYRFALSAVVVLLIALSTSHAAKAEAPLGWRLVWSDDFDQLDQERWKKSSSLRPTNNSRQAYLPEQITTEEGCLVITATDEPYKQLPYRSGLIQTRAAQRFGRWEVRAKLPTTRGMWPAIWLLPDTQQYPWPSGGEIDLMENRGNQPRLTSAAFHYGTNPPYKHHYVTSEQRTFSPTASSSEVDLIDYHAGFHTYAVDWTSTYLRFYVDDVCHYVVYDEDVDGYLSRSEAPMQLILNNAIGGAFLPNPDETTVWPQQMLIDWVHVYEADPEAGRAGWLAPALVNGDFESGSMSGWTRFGNNGSQEPGVRVVQSPVKEDLTQSGFALKLSGSFNGETSYSGIAQGTRSQPGKKVTLSATALRETERVPQEKNGTTTLKIEFYREPGGKHGTSAMIAEFETPIDGVSTDNVGSTHQVSAITPDDAVETRIAVVFAPKSDAAGSVLIDNLRLVTESH